MKNTGSYPRVHVDTAKVSAVGQAGGILLTETIRASGLDRGLSEALDRWRKPLAVHDPGKIILDLAVSLVLGGEALSDIAVLRGEPGVYGSVASDPTVSRLIAALAQDADKAVTAIGSARQQARARAWALAGDHAPGHQRSVEDPLIIDLDATLITAHSEKQQAAPTFKRGFGFHPLMAFADHGPTGTGEALVAHLRPGNAGSNTAADHITVTAAALAQLPDKNPRPGKTILIRADGAGGTKDFTRWLTGRRVSYSVGFTLPMDTTALYHLIPGWVWVPALNADSQAREGADLAELTGLLDLSDWPDGMRVIVRRERPHPGAQLRFDDVDGYRLTAFATNRAGTLQHLELRHRRRARCEDRIRIAKDTGLTNLPLHDFNANRIWCQIVALASELQAWTGLLALAGQGLYFQRCNSDRGGTTMSKQVETVPVAGEGADAAVVTGLGSDVPVVDRGLVAQLVGEAQRQGLPVDGEGGLLAELTRLVLESALEGEITDHLVYDKHERGGSVDGNARNGTRTKTVLSKAGPVQVDVLRDRAGTFEPKIVAKRQRRARVDRGHRVVAVGAGDDPRRYQRAPGRRVWQ